MTLQEWPKKYCHPNPGSELPRDILANRLRHLSKIADVSEDLQHFANLLADTHLLEPGLTTPTLFKFTRELFIGELFYGRSRKYQTQLDASPANNWSTKQVLKVAAEFDKHAKDIFPAWFAKEI